MTTSTPASPALQLGHPRRWLILAIVLAVECMDLLDGTVVNIAAPSIRAELGAGDSALQWIIGGYALSFAIGLVTAGRLGDIFGRRRLFAIGVSGFTLTSLACGIAPTAGALVAMRLVQGVFAALMIPQGFGLLRSAFPTSELPKAFGAFGPVIGLSAVAGPILGGVLVDANLFDTGWRMVFLINLPVGIAALAGTLLVMPESRAENPPGLDLLGAGLIAVAVGLLIYPLIQGQEADWPAWMFVAMAFGGLLVWAFAAYERARDRRGRPTLVTLSMFAHRDYNAGLACISLFFAGMIGVILCLTLTLQVQLGFSPLHAALTLAPWSLGMAVGAGLGAGLLVPKFGRPVLQVGFLIVAAGAALLLATVHAQGDALSSWDLVVPQLVYGVGAGISIAPLFGFVLAAVTDDEVGSASGVLNAVQQLGGAAGVAIIGTLFFGAASLIDGLQIALVIAIGLVLVVGAMSGLLPMQPRDEEELALA